MCPSATRGNPSRSSRNGTAADRTLRETLQYAIQFLRLEVAVLVAASTCAVASAVATGGVAWALGNLAPTLKGARAGSEAPEDTWYATATVVVALLARGLLARLAGWLADRAADRNVARLRTRVHGHLLRLPVDVAARLGAAQLGARIGQESLAARPLLGPLWVQLVQQAVSLAVLLAVVASVWPTAALTTLAALPLVGWLALRISARTRTAQREAWSAHATVASSAAEDAAHLSTWRTADALGWLQARFEARARQALAHAHRASTLRRLAGASLHVVGSGALLLAAAWLSDALSEGRLGSADAARLFGAAALLVGPATALAEAVHGLGAALAPLGRLLRLLEADVEPAASDEPIPSAPSRVRLRGAVVRRGERRVLLGVDLDLRAGRFVAVAGPNGAGKTTLLMAVAGLLPLEEGTLEVDGTTVDEARRIDWCRRVGWLDARAALLEGTVAHNVALEDEPDRERVRGALAEAGMRAWLEQVGGLDARVEPEGANLSAGQRQRIELARAVYLGRRVWLLDEPTAHLDGAAAEWLARRLRAWADAGRIVLLSTHDPRLLAGADEVVVLEGGRLLEVAPPDALSERARRSLPGLPGGAHHDRNVTPV